MTAYYSDFNDWLAHLLFTQGNKGKGIVPPPVPGNSLLQRCVKEDIAPLVYYTIKMRRCEGSLPPETIASLRDFFLINLAHNLRIRTEMTLILRDLSDHHLPHLILKGLALSERYYPHLALRRMTDVDLLVRESDLPRLDRYLASAGYTPIDAILPTARMNPPGYLSSLEYHAPDARPPLHIHWDIVNTSTPIPRLCNYPLSDLWSQAREITIEGATTWIPSPEHMLLHLTEHGLRINHAFYRLILLYDLYLVLLDSRDTVNWEATIALAQRSGLAPMLHFGLLHLSYWVNDIVPNDVYHRLHPSYSSLERAYVWFIRHDVRLRGMSYLLYLSLVRPMKERIRFVIRTLFPPLAIGRQRLKTDQRYPVLFVYCRRFLEIITALGRVLGALFIRVGGKALTSRHTSSRG